MTPDTFDRNALANQTRETTRYREALTRHQEQHAALVDRILNACDDLDESGQRHAATVIRLALREAE